MQNSIMTKPPYLKERLADNELFEVIYPLMKIYRTSEFLNEIDKASLENPDIQGVRTGVFKYKDNYVFNYLPSNKIESSKIAYERAKQIDSPLVDYELLIMEDKICNGFCLIKLPDNDVSAYTFKIDPFMISKEHKERLYSSIEALARLGVVFSPDSLSYNSKNNTFKIMDFSKVSTNGFNNMNEKEKYLSSYKNYLLL